jgi:hypothetical protein
MIERRRRHLSHLHNGVIGWRRSSAVAEETRKKVMVVAWRSDESQNSKDVQTWRK